MNKYTTFFEDLLKIFASFSLILLMAGYFDLKTYYNYFGINISSYVNASEILMASLDNLSIVIFSLTIQFIIWLSFFKYLFDYTEEDINMYWEGKRKPKEYSDDLTIIRFLGNKKIRIFILIQFIVFIIALIFKNIFPHSRFLLQFGLFVFINLWIFMWIYMAWIQSTRIFYNIFKRQENYSPKLLISFVVFVPTLLFTIWVKNAMFVGNHLRKYGNKEKIEMILQNDSIISTNDSIRYLGKTGNYIFFWNKNTWTSTIYSSGQVKEIINYKKK